MDKILYFNSSITSKNKGASYVYATATICVTLVEKNHTPVLQNPRVGDVSCFVEPTDCQTSKRRTCKRAIKMCR